MIRKLTACLISCLLILTCFQTAIHADSSPELTFSENTVTETVSGSGYTIDGTSLSITANGVYTINGTCDEGTLIVEKSLSDVTLILDSLNLSSSSTAPVVIKKGSTVTIHLTGDSVLSDNEDASTEETNADFEGACIKVKSGSSLTFCGSGSLTINGNAKNGIKGGSESVITFNDGTYNVYAANNGIASDHSLIINNGTFDIDTVNDGIKSVPDVDDTVSTGQIIINGGSFEIKSDGDAIQAETLLEINHGDFNIQTMDGSTDTSFDKDTMSAKGIKASGDREDIENLVEINGGTFTLNTADDAIHSDTDITITAGSFEISTQDDGVHADATLNLGTEDGYDRDPSITINASYEGLEGGTVNIYSGKFYTIASDDGINSAGGSSSGSGEAGGDPWKPGRPGEGATGDYTLNIYGGDVFVNCTGDGLDANGDLNLYGGKITVMSMQQGGDNSPLDSDGTITIKDAEVFAAGTNPMNERPGNGSSTYYTSTNRFSAGTVISIKANNTVYYTEQLVRNVNYILYANPSLSTSPSFVSGGSVDPCSSNSWRHAWDEGTIIQEATEESAGVIQYTCTSCGETELQSYRISKDTSCEGHTYEEPEVPVIDEGYPITFTCDEHASINIYYTQDYTSPDETDVTSAVSRNSTTGEPDSTGDGQVNFAVVTDEGYVVDTVTIEGSYKNLKTPADTGAENTYRITKVASELTVNITLKEDDGSGEEPVIDEGYPVTFTCDENASINIYYTQDYTAPDETDVTSAVSRNSTTGEPDSTGDGQVNFAVVPKEGYVVDTVTVEGSYKNLKTPADTGAENTYRITKVASELNVIVTVKEDDGSGEEPVIDEGYPVTFACDENASINIYYTQDYTSPDETGVTSAVSRNSTTGEPDSTGDGQVNFAVVPKEGYVVDTVTIEGSYKNLKTPADTGAENTYRITKVASELNVIVTVKEEETEEPVKPESVSISADSYEIPITETLQLSASVLPADADQDIVWSVSDESVLNIDETGLITALDYGKVTVRAASANNPDIYAECEIQTRFTDVLSPDAYYYTPVYWAADDEITVGYGGGGKFSPYANCTREQIVTFLWRLNGEPEPTEYSEFSDVKETDWFYKSVSWAAEKGITLGLNDGTGRFGVGMPCTREMCVTFLYRAAGSPEVTEYCTFTDVAEGRYFYNAVSWAASKGITVGLNDGIGRFGVGQTCTRAMIVTFLYRYDNQ